MTAPRDFRDFLNDMVSACWSITGFVQGMTQEDYLEDERSRFAVSRGYEILGEAVRHIPDPVKRSAPDIRTIA